MAYNQVTASSLTPSRPAPQAPTRQPSSASSYNSPSRSNTANSFASTTAYAPSIASTTTLNNNNNNQSPVVMPASNTSYATSYSGIGGSPAVGGFPGHMQRNSELGGGGRAGGGDGMGGQGLSGAGIVRSGTVGFKEDAFANWLWREKYLILREQTLAVHKNEVRRFLLLLFVLIVGDRYQSRAVGSRASMFAVILNEVYLSFLHSFAGNVAVMSGLPFVPSADVSCHPSQPASPTSHRITHPVTHPASQSNITHILTAAITHHTAVAGVTYPLALQVHPVSSSSLITRRVVFLVPALIRVLEFISGEWVRECVETVCMIRWRSSRMCRGLEFICFTRVRFGMGCPSCFRQVEARTIEQSRSGNENRKQKETPPTL